MNTLTTPPGYSAVSQKLIDMRSPASVLKYAIDRADIVTGYTSGMFNATFDDKPNDTRVFVCYSGHGTTYKIVQMHGFNPERIIWEQEGRSCIVELDTRRGISACQKTIKSLYDKHNKYPGRSIHLYRQADGTLKAV